MKSRSMRVVILGALSLGYLALGQQVPVKKVFALGTPRTEVWDAFGRPDKWFVLDTGKYLTTEEEFTAGIRVYDVIEDVYMRETRTNLYEFRLGYLADDRSSRLRPIQRLTRLGALVDKPETAKSILSDLPEASQICKNGCDLYGIVFVDNRVYILAYPSNPNQEQKQMGRDLATAFKPDKTKEEWCVGIKLMLEGQNALEKPPDYLGDVNKIEVGPISLHYDLDTLVSGAIKPIKLGTWNP